MSFSAFLSLQVNYYCACAKSSVILHPFFLKLRNKKIKELSLKMAGTMSEDECTLCSSVPKNASKYQQ